VIDLGLRTGDGAYGTAGDAFDPIAEGARYQLSPAVSIEIWERVRGDAASSREAGEHFRRIAARVAASGGRLRPAPGKRTQVELAAQGAAGIPVAAAHSVPGRRTRVAEAYAASPHAVPGTTSKAAPRNKPASHPAASAPQAAPPTAAAPNAEDRDLLELAASDGAGGLASPAIPRPRPADQLTLCGMDRPMLEVSADPAFLRRWIEETYQAQGLPGIDHLPELVADRAADDLAVMRDPSRQRFANDRVLPVLALQIQAFKTEVAAVEQQFRATATQLVSDTLDESERIAHAELARYGIDARTATVTLRGPDDLPGMTVQTLPAPVTGGDNAAAVDMARAAGELAANQRELERMRARLGELRDVERYRAHAEPGAGSGAGAEPAPRVDPHVLAGAPDPAHLPEVLVALARLTAQAEQAHQARIAAHTEAYPLLASYKRLGNGTSGSTPTHSSDCKAAGEHRRSTIGSHPCWRTSPRRARRSVGA
jgi:hypothetical protein